MSVNTPVIGPRASSYAQLWQIVTHPAFRLGFLDARNRRPIAHAAIVERIRTETPERALQRLGFASGLLDGAQVSLAQVRYEEGRLAVLDLGLSCKAWGHPDYPPQSLRDFIDGVCKPKALAA